MAPTIGCAVVLDQPDKTHFGHRDLVHGHILLTCPRASKSSASEAFFGPLRIVLTFSGRTKSKTWISNGRNTSTSRAKVPLFSHQTAIFDQPFSAQFDQTYTFPFALQFPHSVEQGADVFDRKACSTFPSTPGHALPPSMQLASSGTNHHHECEAEYTIQAEASMPGIPVKFGPASPVIVHYSPAGHRLSRTSLSPPKVIRECTVSNKYLLPQDQRPKGFRQNAKAALSSDFYPRFDFSLLASAPNILHVGSRPKLALQIAHKSHAAAALDTPRVQLSSVTISLRALTSVRADKSLLSERTSEGFDLVHESRATLEDTFFSADKDWTITVDGDSMPDDLPPSFATYNIIRQYQLVLTVRLLCAQKTLSIQRSAPITLLNPCSQGSISSESGSSSIHAMISDLAPLYEEVEQLPAYPLSAATKLLARGSPLPPLDLDGLAIKA